MNFFPTLFTLAFFACLYFAARPWRDHTKWHGLFGALVCFIMIGVTGPKQPQVSNRADAKSEPASQANEASEDPTSESPYASPAKQYGWIRVSKDAVGVKLKDADSARYRNVAFYSGGGTPVVCGEVNARNSFGGYSGYERFIAAGSTMAYLESEVSDGIGPVWDKMCVKGPADQAYER